MRFIILCAGQGSRLRPYTDNKPKCMAPLLGEPLIDHQLAAIRAAGDHETYLVTGYAHEVLSGYGDGQFHNPEFAVTNMVTSLFAAREMFDGQDDIIIAYADIVYEPRILKGLSSAEGGITTVVDRNWRMLWEVRMDDPLADAETLKVSDDGRLIEIGSKPTSLDEIQGQYIGLTKVAKNAQQDFCDFYDSLDRDAIYSGQNFANMYMTSFLQELIDSGRPVYASFVSGGWLEVDTPADLAAYEKLNEQGDLAALWRPDRET